MMINGTKMILSKINNKNSLIKYNHNFNKIKMIYRIRNNKNKPQEVWIL